MAIPDKWNAKSMGLMNLKYLARILLVCTVSSKSTMNKTNCGESLQGLRCADSEEGLSSEDIKRLLEPDD